MWSLNYIFVVNCFSYLIRGDSGLNTLCLMAVYRYSTYLDRLHSALASRATFSVLPKTCLAPR